MRLTRLSLRSQQDNKISLTDTAIMGVPFTEIASRVRNCFPDPTAPNDEGMSQNGRY
jgi:hypothetical protein